MEILEKCGIGVAVKNTVIEAKEAAGFICDTNDNDGVVKFLDGYLLIRRSEILILPVYHVPR